MPRPAATVIVMRDSSGTTAFDILMVQRNDTVAFMGGARVPGVASTRVMQRLLGLPGHRSDSVALFGSASASSCIAWPRFELEESAFGSTLHDLVPFAHWVTPEVETRRYDTRFFLIEMPAGQKRSMMGGDDSSGLAVADRCHRSLSPRRNHAAASNVDHAETIWSVRVDRGRVRLGAGHTNCDDSARIDSRRTDNDADVAGTRRILQSKGGKCLRTRVFF